MQQLRPLSFVSNAAFSLGCQHTGLNPNELHRLYYVVYNTSGFVYKGHGDVRYGKETVAYISYGYLVDRNKEKHHSDFPAGLFPCCWTRLGMK